MKSQPTPLFRRGFTLIEILTVIAIIAILSAISMGGYSYVTKKKAESTAELQKDLLSKALEEYKLDNGAYPETGPDQSASVLYQALYSNGLNETPPGKIYLAELDPESKAQGWIDASGGAIKIIDPWGEEYIYRRGDHPDAKNPDFDLLSKGPDKATGVADTEIDDIDNF